MPPPPPKHEGYRVSVCQKCRQPRMVAIKPATSPAKIAAKLAKQIRAAEEARRAQESIVAAKAFMHRHSVGDEVARRAHSRPPSSCWLVGLFPGGGTWYTTLKESSGRSGFTTGWWRRLGTRCCASGMARSLYRFDFGDGSHEVRCYTQHCTISSQRGH